MFIKHYISNRFQYIFLSLILLLPHGLGFRFNIGAVDLPRLFIIITIILGVIVTFKQVMAKRTVNISRGALYLIGFSLTVVLSALLSSSPLVSLLLATKLLMVWTIFPLAFHKLSSKDTDEVLQRYLMIIIIFYIGFCLTEMITQKYFYPAWIRTVFWNYEGYEWINSRLLKRGAILLAQGPFLWNHGMAGMLCALCGIAFKYNCQNHIGGKLICVGFVIALLSTGVRAALVAVTILIFIRLITHKDLKLLVSFIVGLAISNMYYIIKNKSLGPMFYTADLTNPWTQSNFSVEVGCNALSSLTGMKLSNACNFLESLGVLGSKLSGLLVNLVRIKEWALHGYGFGSYQHPGLITSNAFQYDDPGLIMLFFFE